MGVAVVVSAAVQKGKGEEEEKNRRLNQEVVCKQIPVEVSARRTAEEVALMGRERPGGRCRRGG